MFKVIGRLNWRPIFLSLVMVAFTAYHLYSGTRNTANSVYSTYGGVFDEYMNSALRLVFPVIVTILSGLSLQNMIKDKFVASVRTRETLREFVWKQIRAGMARNALFFASVGILTTICATWIAPALSPNLVQPNIYGMTVEQSVAAFSSNSPLGFAIRLGPVAYGLASTVWMVLGALVFSLVAIASVLTVDGRLALLIPFGIYLAESILTQVTGAAWSCFLLELPTPQMLRPFPITMAATPSIVAGLASIAVIAFAVSKAEKNGTFA